MFKSYPIQFQTSASNPIGKTVPKGTIRNYLYRILGITKFNNKCYKLYKQLGGKLTNFDFYRGTNLSNPLNKHVVTIIKIINDTVDIFDNKLTYYNSIGLTTDDAFVKAKEYIIEIIKNRYKEYVDRNGEKLLEVYFASCDINSDAIPPLIKYCGIDFLNE